MVGQSDNRARQDAVLANQLATAVPDQSYYLSGLTATTGAQLGVSGAGLLTIDTNVPAAGFVSTAAQNVVSPAFTVQQLRAAKWRADGAPEKGVLWHDDGYGGLRINAFDPNNGIAERPMGRNQHYRFSECARLCAEFDVGFTASYYFHAMQGNGDRVGGASDAQYHADWMAGYIAAVLANALVDLPAPRPLVIAAGGQVSSVNSDYFMTQTAYWLAHDLGGIVPTWHRIYTTLDNIGHMPPEQMALVGETTAWALEVEEAGGDWTIWYDVVKSNLLVEIRFFLQPGETLMNRPDLFDLHGGLATCPDFGFQSDAAITSVTPNYAAGTVQIQFAAQPTWLSLAMQRQDMREHEHEGTWMSGHRTTLFGSLTRPSAVVPGQTLYRPVPSIFVRFAGNTTLRMNGEAF